MLEYVPLVTPRGNPAKVGSVVATPALGEAQQWMCDAVVPAVSPLKFSKMDNV